MDWLSESLTAIQLQEMEQFLSDWFLVLSLGFLLFELIRYAFQKRLNWSLIGDTATNFVTQALFIATTVALFFAFYISALTYVHQFALFDFQLTWWSLALCVVLADFAYYWEHRFSHRVAMAWATHTVHHSSPHFNMSVAYRFGPMDAIWPLIFQAPIVLLGFDPFAVLFAEAVVLLYQTFLHTEVIGILPKLFEAIFNTPSHHRVHHGSNEAYIDKNYGGILIIWDRIFGTFAEEKEKVVFGITEPLGTVNPFVVFFHGLARLWKKLNETVGVKGKIAVMLNPPA